MNSFELNKIFGAVLGALVFVMGIGFLAEAIYAPIQDRGATYLLPEPEPGEGVGPSDEPGVEPIAARMQEASASAGEQLINRCQSCHDYSPANTNRAGPGIYDVMGEVIAHRDDFGYSGALEELNAQGEAWDYENMDAFLESPRNFAQGTTMTFAGLSNPMDRANLIAFLRELSDDPIPLPEAPAEEEAAEDDAAEEANGEAVEDEAAEDANGDASEDADANGDAAQEDEAGSDAEAVIEDIVEEDADTDADAAEETGEEQPAADEDEDETGDEDAQ